MIINVHVSSNEDGLYLHVERGREIGYQVVTTRMLRRI